MLEEYTKLAKVARHFFTSLRIWRALQLLKAIA